MRRRTKDLLDAVMWIADTQHGLITASQLSEIGFASSTLQRRTRTGGPWRRLLPGIYTVTNGMPTVEQREQAGLLFAGAGGCLTGFTALRRRGVRYLPDGPASGMIHTLIPIDRHRKSSGFVIIERTHRLPATMNLGGFPCASVARAVVDGCRRITDRRATRALLLETVQSGMTTVEELSDELRRAQRRGTALLSDALKDARAGVRSAPEAEVRDLVLQAPIPEPLWNPSIYLPDDTFLAQPDGLIAESMVAIEVDSRAHHSAKGDWENTLDRHTELTSAGLLVVHIAPSRFRANPMKYVDQIVTTHRQGLQRTLPNLRVVPKHS